MVQVGYQVTDPNDSDAIYQIITQLDPTVTLVGLRLSLEPLEPSTYPIASDEPDYALLKDGLYYELPLVHSVLGSDFYLPHDESMQELFDSYDC